MSEDFTGQEVKLTYQSLLHLDPDGTGISVNFEQVYDGDGTASALYVSSTSIKVGSVVLSGQYIQLEDSGLDYVRIASPTNITTSYTVTMPTAGPAGANYILESDASGNLSWIATPGGGTPAPVDAQYVTLALNGTLTNERVLTAGSNISLTDAGANSTVTVAVTGIGTTIQGFDATLTALAAYNTNGILTQTAADTFTGRTITGTAAEITVTNGDGVLGNPTLSLPTALTFTGKTVTNGTFTTPTINVNDNALSIRDDGDTTKIIQFQASGITTGTTRTLTVPDASGTIALTTNLPNTFGTIAISGQSDVVADSTTDTLTLAAGANITLTTNAATDTVTIAASGGSSNSFSTIAVSGQSDVVADSSTDTLTLVAGTNITITTNAGTDTITVNSTGGGTGTSIGLAYSLANTAFI